MQEGFCGLLLDLQKAGRLRQSRNRVTLGVAEHWASARSKWHIRAGYLEYLRNRQRA
jgi:hypothetical protein